MYPKLIIFYLWIDLETVSERRVYVNLFMKCSGIKNVSRWSVMIVTCGSHGQGHDIDPSRFRYLKLNGQNYNY